MAAKIFILAFAVLIWQANSQQCEAPINKNPPPLAEESPSLPNLRRPFTPESAPSTEASSLKCNNRLPWNKPKKSALLNKSPSLPIPRMSAFTSSASETLPAPLGKPNSLYDKNFLQSSQKDLDCAPPKISNFRKDTVQDSKLSQFSKRFPSSVRRNATSLLPCNVPCANTDRDLGLSMPTFTSLSSSSGSQNYSEKPKTNPVLETSRPFLNSCGPQFDYSSLSSKPILRDVSKPTSTLAASKVLPINSFSFSSEPQIHYNSPLGEVNQPFFSVFEPPNLPIKPSLILKPSLPNCKPPFSALENFAPQTEILPSPITSNQLPYLPTFPKSNCNTVYGSANSMVLKEVAESTFDAINSLEVSLPIRPSIISTSNAAVSGINTNKNPLKPTNSAPFGTTISSPITNFGSMFWEGKNNLCNSLPQSIGSDIDACIEPFNSYPLGAHWNRNRVESDDISDVINPFNINHPTKEFSSNTLRAQSNLASPSSCFPDTLVNIEPSVICPSTPCESSNNFFDPSRYATVPEAPVTYKTSSFDSNSCGSFGNFITPINIGPLREITPTSRGLKEVLSSLPGHVGITGIVNNGFQPCGETSEPTVSSSVSVDSSTSSISALQSIEPNTPLTLDPVSSEIFQSSAQPSVIAESNNKLSANLKDELTQFSSSAFSSASSISTPYTTNIISSPGLTESSASPTQSSLSLAEASGSITSDLRQTNSAGTLSASSIRTTQDNPMVVSPCKPTSFTNTAESIPSTTFQSVVTEAEASSSISPNLEQTVLAVSSIGTGKVNLTPFGAEQVNPEFCNPYPSNSNVNPEDVGTNFSPECKLQSPIVPNTQSSVSVAKASNSISPSVGQSTSIASTKTTTSVSAETLVPTAISTNSVNLGSTISSTSTAVAETTTPTSTSYAASETTSLPPTIAEIVIPVTYSSSVANISPTSSSVATMSPILSSCATSESINSIPTETSISTTSASSTTAVETPSASVSTISTAMAKEQSASASSAKGTVISTSSVSSTSSSSSATSGVVNPTLSDFQLPSVPSLNPSQNLYNLEINPVTLEVQIPSAFGSPLPSPSYKSAIPSSCGSISPSLMYELQLPPSIPAQFSCSLDSMPVFNTNVEPVSFNRWRC